MASFHFQDSVKPNALHRYILFTNIAKLFQLIEVFVAIAVALISWSSNRLSFLFKLSGEYLLAFSSKLMNQHVVFFVGNVIIVVCYVLSRREFYDEKHGLTSEEKIIEDTSSGESVQPPVNESQVMETAREENRDQTARYEDAIVKTESEIAAETAIRQAAKQIERFRRTHSAKLKREISIKPQEELRRWATTSRNGMFATVVDRTSTAISCDSVEKLSNEEFRLAVETFIAKQQSFLKQQSMAENGILFLN